MERIKRTSLVACIALFMPVLAQARGLADEMNGLHGVLDHLYDEMMPLCSELIGVSQGIAGFGAIWYISTRVWRHIANAEPIDFYPLFRPFVLGFCIMIFPSVLDLINGIMKPTVTATAAMVEGSKDAIAVLLKQKEEALKETEVWQMYVGDSGYGDRELWYQHTHDGQDSSQEGLFAGIGNDIKFAMSKMTYNLRNWVKQILFEFLRILFEAAALCIDTIRTFQLIVLAILGPFVFGLAVFDGFQHTLTAWLARYINIFLWLPVANIFGSIIGKIQQQMLSLDIAQIGSHGDTMFSSTDLAHLVFLIIGIVGYWTVPSIANYIIQAGGAGALQQKMTGGLSSTISTASFTSGNEAKSSAAETMSQGRKFGDFLRGNSSESSNSGGSGYQRDKLSGK